MEKANGMENKKPRNAIQGNNKDYLSCINKIINHQEQLYNVVYRDGKWIRRRKCQATKKRQI